MSNAINKSSNTRESAEMYTDGTYLEKNSTWHVEDSPWKATQIHMMLSKNNVIPKTVCEVGCGAGEILKQLSLKMPNTDFCGYELSPQAFELCKTRESDRLRYSLKNILNEDVFFDSLLCIDVFEHIEDYFGFLREIKNKAEFKVFHIPLDINVLSVAKGYMHSVSEGHIHYFTRDSALATLNNCGYQIIDESYTMIFDYIKSKSVKRRLIQTMQRQLFKLAPHLEVRLLGGCSLIVLAK